MFSEPKIKNLKLVKQPPRPNVQYSIISSRDICSSTDFREEAPFSTAMFLSNSIEVRHTWAEKINKERESGASAKATRLSSTVAVKSEKGRAMRRVKLVSLRNFLYEAFDFSVCRPVWRLRSRRGKKKPFTPEGSAVSAGIQALFPLCC